MYNDYYLQLIESNTSDSSEILNDIKLQNVTLINNTYSMISGDTVILNKLEEINTYIYNGFVGCYILIFAIIFYLFYSSCFGGGHK